MHTWRCEAHTTTWLPPAGKDKPAIEAYVYNLRQGSNPTRLASFPQGQAWTGHIPRNLGAGGTQLDRASAQMSANGKMLAVWAQKSDSRVPNYELEYWRLG
jgi:hypothetical protein